MAELFDEAELLERVDNDVGFLAETVEMLATDGPTLISSIRAAIESGDSAALGKHAHSLKGMISNFCAQETQDSALALEKMGKAADLAGAPAALKTLEEQVTALTAALQTFIKAKA